MPLPPVRPWIGAVALSWGGPAVVRAAEPEEVVVEGVVDGEPAAGTVEVGISAVARPGDGVEDVIATVPGAVVRRLGGLGAFAGVSLRGTGFRQTLVRLDGVPLNPDGVEGVDLSQWPLAGLASIAVTRGRPAATVGAAPVGGVVDLRTAEVAYAEANAAIGAFGTARGAASGGGPTGWGDVLVGVDALATAGRFPYVDDGGTLYVPEDDEVVPRVRNARQQVAGMARVRVGSDAARGTALVSAAERIEDLPGPIGAPLRDASLRTSRWLGSVSGSGRVGAGRMTGQLWGRVRAERLADGADQLGLIAGAQRDRFGAVGVSLSGEGALHGMVQLRGSVDARREDVVRRLPDGEVPLRRARWGAGAAVDLPVSLAGGRAVITPGVDGRVLAAEDAPEDVVGAVLPGLVVEGRPGGGVLLWASGTGAFRPPDLTELYGNRGALQGNPDLRPERAWKVEGGVRAGGGADTVWRIEAVGFATWARDALGWIQNTQRTLIAVNFGQTRTAGVEAGAHLAWRDRVGVDVSLGWMDAVQTGDDVTRRGRPVPFVPAWRAWSRAWVAPGWGVRLGVDVDHTAAAFVDPQGVTTQPPRTLLGGFAAWTAPGGVWILSIDLRNLLDARTAPVDRDPLGPDDTRVPAPLTDFVGYPLPGRTWLVGVRFTPPVRQEDAR